MNSSTVSLADTASSQPGKRILIIDQTAPGGTTATGALKETYFGDLPREQLLVIHDAGALNLIALRAGLGRSMSNSRIYRENDRSLELARNFQPDILIYRPLPSAPKLHSLACTLAIDDGVPLLLWFMDDWPERLRATDPEQADLIEDDLRRLASRAEGCFAISKSMAEAFRERYGGPEYQIARNGIRAEDWSFSRPPNAANGDVLVRYSGALAPDMSFHSMVRLAHVISDLVTQGSQVRLEIRTQSFFLHEYGKHFKNLPGVSIGLADGSQAEYRRWIADADIGVVAYNFDEDTIRYTRYSFANKVPELMAAGPAILAIGPTEIETIRYLKDHGVAAIADRPETLKAVVQDLLDDPARRQMLAAAAKEHATQMTLKVVRREMDVFLEGTGRAADDGSDAVSVIRNAPVALGWRALNWICINARVASREFVKPLSKVKKLSLRLLSVSVGSEGRQT